MSSITLDGTLLHQGIAGDPIVLLTVFDEGPFCDWCREQKVRTEIFRHKDPKSGNDRDAIYVTESAITGIPEGAEVRVTVEVRADKRGNGLGIASVVPR